MFVETTSSGVPKTRIGICVHATGKPRCFQCTILYTLRAPSRGKRVATASQIFTFYWATEHNPKFWIWHWKLYVHTVQLLVYTHVHTWKLSKMYIHVYVHVGTCICITCIHVDIQCRPDIGWNVYYAEGDCLASRPDGHSRPRELWFSIYSCGYMYYM